MIMGWANYYRASHSSEAFGKLDTFLYRRLSIKHIADTQERAKSG
jgi:hypothetical protein